MASQNNAISVRKLVDKYFSLQWCRDNLVVPLFVETSLPKQIRTLKIAIANFSYLGTIAEPIKQRINQSEGNLRCEFVERSQEEIQEILDQASEERFISDDLIQEFDEDAVLQAVKDTSENNADEEITFEFDDDVELDIEDEILDLDVEMMESKIQKAAGLVLIHSKKQNVSDIHIEPREDSYKIRVRKDGVMQKFMSLPREPGIQLLACLKNMANMDIAERRASQDGKIIRKFESKKMELRCSTNFGMNGESMVLKILNSDSSSLNLDILIHVDSVREDFKRLINEKNGIIIFSGPTGSGKSTTLAASLREKDNGELKIVTAEDPIEYELGGDILQYQVSRANGQTFAKLVRTLLRQDPDVILVGETRDPDTAEASLDAAESGHLVFTTLHADSSSSSITRLVDMNIPKYKLNSFIKGVLSQRLVRRVCSECSFTREVTEDESRLFGLRRGTAIRCASSLSAEEKQKKKNEDSLCTKCQGVGYKGRLGVYELLIVNEQIQDAISEGKKAKEIEYLAESDLDMLTFMKYALELVKEELTTLSEVIRIFGKPS